MAAVDRRKETVNRKAEDAREFVELLEQMTEADKERIKYVMIGLKMGETVRTGLTACFFAWRKQNGRRKNI